MQELQGMWVPLLGCRFHSWVAGSTHGSGESPGVGNGNPLQYSCLENPINRGAWQATGHGIVKSRTQLSTHIQRMLAFLIISTSVSPQSCPTLCNPMDYSLPDPSIHGIFQARILKWVTISFSRRSSQPIDWTQVSHIVGRRFTTREVIKNLASKITRWLFWGASLPSSRSADFLNKVIFLSSTLHLRFIGLSCGDQSKSGLDNNLP